jgi:protein TonB
VPPANPSTTGSGTIEGTVIVQALVGRDGTVKDTKVVKSDNAALNEPAVTAVRQWRFKPAKSKGQSVAVWVAIPVKFSTK